MSTTKERILKTALELFACRGFEAVSVNDIAEKLGITKGALYKHYQNKRDIFDSIVAKMYEIDRERAQNFSVPEETIQKDPEAYRHASLRNLAAFMLAQFDFWTRDSFGAPFRRMLVLEQYKDAHIATLYERMILWGPVEYTRDILAQMMEEGTVAQGDALFLATAFYAPLYLLIQKVDHTQNNEELTLLLKKHNDEFLKKITLK